MSLLEAGPLNHDLSKVRKGYGVPNVSKTLTNAIFVCLPLIYKCDTDLAKYLPDLCIYLRQIYKC